MLNPLFHNSFLNAHPGFYFLLFAILAVAAIVDYKTYTIPHKFTFAVIGLFIIAALVSGLQLTVWPWHILSGVVAFSAALILFVLGLMGGGDVKIFGAIGLWTTPAGLLGLIFCVTMSGLIISLLYLLTNMISPKSSDNKSGSITSWYQKAKTARIAYGPAITIGTLIFFLLSS